MADPDVTIEHGNSEDAEALTDLWVDLAADQRQYDSHLLPEANRQRVNQTMLKHVVTNTVFVARRGAEVVGFVTFGQESESYQQDATRGVVHNIYVRSGDRDEGIGSELLAAAERALADRGVDTLSLQAMADNDGAREFYRRHGYAPHRVEFEKPTGSDTLTTDDG